jgi:hypothetical protein
MEVPPGNSLCSYLKQAKMSFPFLLQNWRTGGRNRSHGEGLGEVVPVGGGGGGERVWEGEYGTSTVYTCI